jgi:protein TonB
VTGLAYSAFKKAVERVTTVDIEEPPPPEEEPPPPPPDEVQPPPIVAPAAADIHQSAPPPITVVDTPPARRPRWSRALAPPAPSARAVEGPVARLPMARAAGPCPAIQEQLSRSRDPDEIGGFCRGPRDDQRARSRHCLQRHQPERTRNVLDEAACDGMTRYARYNPALG